MAGFNNIIIIIISHICVFIFQPFSAISFKFGLIFLMLALRNAKYNGDTPLYTLLLMLWDIRQYSNEMKRVTATCATSCKSGFKLVVS